MYKLRLEKGPGQLIEAVKPRRALYDKNDPNYHNHGKYKVTLWKEVCSEIIPNWEKITPQKQVEIMQEVQRRWKSLRTCFSREIYQQKKENAKRENGEFVKKRKKYGYFKHLKFLLSDPDTSFVKDEEDSSEESDKDFDIEIDKEKEEDTECESNDDDGYLIVNVSSPSKEEKVNTKKKGNKRRKSEDVSDYERFDDDKHFCLSLVPSFKNMTDREKFEARIAILQIINGIAFKND